MMLTEPMKLLFQRFDEMVNKPNPGIADDILASDFVGYFPLVPPLTRSNFKSYMRGLYDSFPDLIMEINAVIISGDHLVLRVTYYGTHDVCF